MTSFSEFTPTIRSDIYLSTDGSGLIEVVAQVVAISSDTDAAGSGSWR